MKRDFDEISDDEWSNHSFNPSRILKTTPSRKHKSNPPPPLESFAFRKPQQNQALCYVSSSDDCVEVKETVNLEDDDVEEVVEERKSVAVNRGRRFVVDDDEEEEEEEEEVEEEGENGRGFTEVYDLITSDDEEEFEEEEDDGDVVGKALQKCAKLSAELKRELYGSGVTSCDRYAEVESSSIRIVTQDDIDAACALEEDSDFQPVLKPYQLVGVNFLLLLYQKGVGGGTFAISLSLSYVLGRTTFYVIYLPLC